MFSRLCKPIVTVTIVVATIGGITALRAQPPFGGPPLDPVSQALDTNHDGTISADEIDNAVQSLKALDKNEDGKLTFEEIAPLGPPGFGGAGGGRRGPRGPRVEPKLVMQFDADGNGVLDRSERQKARAHLKENPVPRGPGGGRDGRRSGRRGGLGFGGPGTGRSGPPGEVEVEPKPGPSIAVEDAVAYPDAPLYDTDVLRTFFFEFDEEDWEQEIAEFYRTDVEVLGQLTVDGKTYKDVGVAFRGNSSFFTVGEGHKRSLNVSIDALHEDQRLHGYKTLNLLNGHADPSFMREALFSHIAGHYLPTPKVNFAKVVINGKSWGIYVNAQQYNKDFLQDWFRTKEGVRWKIPAGPGGGGSLVYQGDEEKDYGGFQLKTSKARDPHANLIALCKTLDDVDPLNADTGLDSILNVDQALWFLAMENVFIDGDGYISRGSDYTLYEHPSGRFHLIPYDNNETFRFAGGGGPGIRIPGAQGVELDPLALIDERERPIIQKLLNNPRLRARYMAHVRTLVDDWLDWQKLLPILTRWRSLLDNEVQVDTRKLYSYEAFVNADEGVGRRGPRGGRGPRGAPGLKTFVDGRRDYLLNHPELQKPAPRISQLDAHLNSQRDTVRITAQVASASPLKSMILRYSFDPFPAPMQRIEMHDDGQHDDGPGTDGVYGGEIANLSGGQTIRYYVEAWTESTIGTVAFEPAGSEMQSATLTVPRVKK